MKVRLKKRPTANIIGFRLPISDAPCNIPYDMPFEIFATAKVVQPILGQPFTYVGYETGGFTGVPAAAFKWLPRISGRGVSE
jgi:hypothetical protein